MKIRDTLYLILLVSFLTAIAFVMSPEKSHKVQALEVVIEDIENPNKMNTEIQYLRKSTDEVMYQTYEIMHMIDEDSCIGTAKKTCTKKSAR